MGSDQATIVVVDDDPEMVSVLCDVLRAGGYRALSANTGSQALAIVKQEAPDLLISDLRMSEMTGHQVQLELKQIAPSLPVVIITAFGSIQTAVQSMKLGAFDYITKPFGNDELMMTVARALEDRHLRQEVRRLRKELAYSYGLPNIIGTSARMAAVMLMIEQVADSGVSVLLSGETGTGKDLLARSMHFGSARRDGPFVPVNCAAIPETLIESELFGYVRGAFTDARESKTGLLAAASGGTLFLDEIGEMPPPLQAKLLRVIEDKKVRSLGATKESPVDVRIVAATNSDLDRAVEQGKFRSDLYYRVATVSIAVPPLRERPEDIPLLTRHFLLRAGVEAGKPPPPLAPEAVTCLTRYRWPGNIRELRSAIQHAVIFCTGDSIVPGDLPPRVTGTHRSPMNLDNLVARRLALEELEREYINAVLASVNGNKSEAAAVLRIDRTTLYRKLEDQAPTGDSDLAGPSAPESRDRRS